MAQRYPCPRTNHPAQTVYPLQGSKVHPNFENKKNFQEKIFLASTKTRKICWFHWWNPFLNPSTIKGDICTFVTAMSGLSNRTYHRSLRDAIGQLELGSHATIHQDDSTRHNTIQFSSDRIRTLQKAINASLYACNYQFSLFMKFCNTHGKCE